MGLSLRLYGIDGDFVPSQMFERINRELIARGASPHVEPTDLDTEIVQRACRFEEYRQYPSIAFPYPFVSLLRRAYVLHHLGADLSDDDAYLNHVEGTFPEIARASHLCWHGDADGIYVPVDFPGPVMWLDNSRPAGRAENSRRPAGRAENSRSPTERAETFSVGSSFRLRDELLGIAPALGLDSPDPVATWLASPNTSDDPLEAEKHTLAALLEMARLSIEYKTALVFS